MIRATLLGCGSSGGVPRLGGRWGACDPNNPKNRRRRCSLLVERSGPDGVTQVLIDTGPDMVPQLLDAEIETLDAVIYTHSHADHIHGIDDLRQLVFNARRIMPVWADDSTSEALLDRFGYIFESPQGSLYPPVAKLNRLTEPVEIEGPGGKIMFQPFRVQHGSITALGFRIGGLVYLPDVSDIPESAWPLIEGAELFICDALRYEPHPTHAHLAQTLEWLERSKSPRGIVTNMHIDMDYEAVMAQTPDHILPAYDGMVVEVADDSPAPAKVII